MINSETPKWKPCKYSRASYLLKLKCWGQLSHEMKLASSSTRTEARGWMLEETLRTQHRSRTTTHPPDLPTGVSHFRPEDRRSLPKTADRAHSSQFVRTGRSHRPSQLIKRGWDGVWGIRNTLLRSCSIEPTELSVLIKIVREVQVPINCRVINHKVAGSRLVPSRQVGITNLPVYKH